MILSLQEIIDVVLMSIAIGYIFYDTFGGIAHRKEDYDPLRHHSRRFDADGFKFAVIVTAPAILLHELGHKFVAMYFGFNATFHAAYFWLFLGIVMKLLNFSFIFFIPAYVSYGWAATAFQSSMIAFAGPFVNLVLWLVPLFILKQRIEMKRIARAFLFLTSKINMFLFIFNMLPIPGFDGYHFFSGLARIFL